jgi:hypothetical protein
MATRRSIDLAELADEPFLLTELGGTCADSNIMLHACRNAGFAPNVRLESEDYNALQGMAAAGLGVSIVPRLATIGSHPGVVLRPLKDPAPSRTILAAVAKDRDALVDTFVDSLRAAGDELDSKSRLTAVASRRLLLAEARQLAQEVVQRRALLVAERRKALLPDLARDGTHPLKLRLTLVGQVDRALAPVGGIGATLGEPARLQLVQHRDHRAAVHARVVRKVLLGRGGAGVEHGHDAEVARVQSERLQRRGEPPPGPRAEIVHEEPRELAQLSRWLVIVQHLHDFTLRHG